MKNRDLNYLKSYRIAYICSRYKRFSLIFNCIYY